MRLRDRLTLAYALAMALTLLGTSVVLYGLVARDLRGRFDADLLELARAHAELAVGAAGVRLRAVPPSLVPAVMVGVEARLLDPAGSLLEALPGSGAALRLPAGALRAAIAGQPASFGPDRARSVAGWLGGLLPGPGERRGAAFPIVSLAGGAGAAFVVVVSAVDGAAARTLAGVRAVIVAGLGAGALVSLLVGRVLAARVTRPLSDVARTAAAVERGDLAARVPGDAARDEVGALKRSLNAMLARLEALVDAQRRFAADAAHDLRTPVAVLRTELEVALRRPRGARAYREAIGRALEQVRDLGALAEDLLVLARAEAGAGADWAAFELSEALAPVLGTYARAAAAKGLGFDCGVPAGAWVRGDRALVARAVANLLDNAVALTERGEVGVSVVASGERVRVRVHDTGPGLPDGAVGLFERFRKGERSGGAGLGLSIVREVARAHGGEATAGGRDGGGAVFTLELPAARPLIPA